MNADVIDRMRKANPVPRPSVVALEAQLRDRIPSFDAAPPSPRNRKRRRGRVIMVAVAVAALVAGPALAFRFGVVDFASAPPAPRHVVRDFSSLSVGAPPGMDPGVEARETRLIGTLGGHRLWVAPTEQGGLCYVFEQASGGCDRLGTVPLSVTWGAPRPGGAGGLTQVDGFVQSRWIDGVQIALDDGPTVSPDVHWISAPIGAGFFFYSAPSGRAIVAVRGLHDGDVVEADPGGGGAAGPHPFADLARKTKVASVDTQSGEAILWTAPTRTDERCTWLQLGQREIPIERCLPKGYEHQTGYGFRVLTLGGRTILTGMCGYAALELVHGDGTTRRVTCSDGLVFAVLDAADSAGTVRALDAAGHPIPRSTIGVAQAKS